MFGADQTYRRSASQAGLLTELLLAVYVAAWTRASVTDEHVCRAAASADDGGGREDELGDCARPIRSGYAFRAYGAYKLTAAAALTRAWCDRKADGYNVWAAVVGLTRATATSLVSRPATRAIAPRPTGGRKDAAGPSRSSSTATWPSRGLRAIASAARGRLRPLLRLRGLVEPATSSSRALAASGPVAVGDRHDAQRPWLLAGCCRRRRVQFRRRPVLRLDGRPRAQQSDRRDGCDTQRSRLLARRERRRRFSCPRHLWTLKRGECQDRRLRCSVAPASTRLVRRSAWPRRMPSRCLATTMGMSDLSRPSRLPSLRAGTSELLKGG